MKMNFENPGVGAAEQSPRPTAEEIEQLASRLFEGSYGLGTSFKERFMASPRNTSEQRAIEMMQQGDRSEVDKMFPGYTEDDIASYLVAKNAKYSETLKREDPKGWEKEFKK